MCPKPSTLCVGKPFFIKNLFNFEKSGARFPHRHDGKGSATQFLGSMLRDFQGSVWIRGRISCREARYPNIPLGMNIFFRMGLPCQNHKKNLWKTISNSKSVFLTCGPLKMLIHPLSMLVGDPGPIWHVFCIFGVIDANFDSRCHKSPNPS